MDYMNTGTPNNIDARGRSTSRGVHNGIAFVNFKAHKFSYLNITSLGTDYVLNGKECGVARVNIPSSLSFNLVAFYDINGRILCKLLPSDKYNNSDKFISRNKINVLRDKVIKTQLVGEKRELKMPKLHKIEGHCDRFAKPKV